MANIRDTSVILLFFLDFVCTIREFMDMFPLDLPIMPMNQDINFIVDAESSKNPISIPPYRMVPTKLNELKNLLQELLDKGFIRPNVSPWGAPVLFVKKMMGLYSCVLIIDSSIK